MWSQQIITTDRGNFEVFVKGKGKPLSVSHLYSVFNETGDYFADSLTEFYQVYLINLKGAGNSSPIKIPCDLSIKESVKDIESVRKQLGINKWTYAGHSTGGMIGLEYATTFESALEALILVGTAGSKDYKERPDCIYNKGRDKYQRLQDIFKLLMSNSLTSIERKNLSNERINFSLYKPANHQLYFSKSIHKSLSTKHLEYFSFCDLPRFDVRDKLKSLQLQTLIICGEYDVQCPVRCSKELNQLISRSTFHIFKESNHYPFVEESNKFKKIISDFSNGEGEYAQQGKR